MSFQLTFVHPVWDPVENLVVLAVGGDLLRRCRGAGLDIYVIFPNVGLKVKPGCTNEKIFSQHLNKMKKSSYDNNEVSSAIFIMVFWNIKDFGKKTL